MVYIQHKLKRAKLKINLTQISVMAISPSPGLSL